MMGSSSSTPWTWIILCLWIVGLGLLNGISETAAAAANGGSDLLGQDGTSEGGQSQLRVITMQFEPYVRLRWEPGVLAFDRYEGYYIDLMRALANEMGRTFKMKLVPDAKIGNRGDSGNWNGMLGEIMRGRADIALTPIAVTQERLGIVNFTQPLGEIKLAIIASKDIENEDRTDGATPMQYGVIAGSNADFLLKQSDQSNDQLSEAIQGRPRAIVGSIYEGLERTRRENFALIVEQTIAEYYIRQSPCDLKIIGSFMGDSHYALAVRDDIDLLRDVNRALHALISDSDTWRRLQSRWWRSMCSSIPHLFTDNGNSNPPYGGSLRLTRTEAPPLEYFKIASVLQEPYLMQSSSPGRRYQGYMVDLMDEVARRVPFRYRWIVENRIGKQKGGTWNGVVGKLVDGTADIGAVPFTTSRKLGQVLSFTESFMHSTLSILMKEPSFGEGEDFPIFFMEDLLNQTTMEFGIVKKSRVEKLIRKSKEKVYQDIWKRILSSSEARNNRNQPGNIVSSFEEGLERIRGDNFALIVENVEAALVTSRQPCDLLAMDQFRSMIGYSFGVKAENPLVHKINQALVELTEEGVLQTLFHKWWYRDDCMSATDDPRIFEMSFTDPQTTTLSTTTTSTTAEPTITTPTTTTTTIRTTPDITESITMPTTTRRRNRKRKKNRKHKPNAVTTEESTFGTTILPTTLSPPGDYDTDGSASESWTEEDASIPVSHNIAPPSEGGTNELTTAPPVFEALDNIDEWIFPDSDVDATYPPPYEEGFMANGTAPVVYNPQDRNLEWFYHHTVEPEADDDIIDDDVTDDATSGFTSGEERQHHAGTDRTSYDANASVSCTPYSLSHVVCVSLSFAFIMSFQSTLRHSLSLAIG